MTRDTTTNALYSYDPDIRAYALGEQMEARDWHPRQVAHSRPCPQCGQYRTVMGDDGVCGLCSESPEEAYERRCAERERSIRLGRERTAAILERMGWPERALVHRGAK
jgi:hypothetical protein